jgi:hypothetical protein
MATDRAAEHEVQAIVHAVEHEAHEVRAYVEAVTETTGNEISAVD